MARGVALGTLQVLRHFTKPQNAKWFVSSLCSFVSSNVTFVLLRVGWMLSSLLFWSGASVPPLPFGWWRCLPSRFSGVFCRGRRKQYHPKRRRSGHHHPKEGGDKAAPPKGEDKAAPPTRGVQQNF